MSDIAIRNENGLEEIEDVFGLELKIIDAVVGKITTNASQVLEAVKEKCAEYKDIEKFIGKEDVAKKERAQLNKAMKRADDTAKHIKDMWIAPLNEFDATMKLVKAEFKTASGGLDELVKNVENREKDEKRLEIQHYFDTKNFDLVPLDRIFNDRWLNKTFKMPDIRKEIDSAVSSIYANIKILERIPEHGATAKALYLDTLDMAAALQQVENMKINAERLAKEQVEREERERQEQIEQNRNALEKEKRESVPPSERMSELVNQALDIPMPEIETPQKPEIIEFTLRFRGTKEKLFALKAWMNENGVAWEKIG
jgi:hypothetical protein